MVADDDGLLYQFMCVCGGNEQRKYHRIEITDDMPTDPEINKVSTIHGMVCVCPSLHSLMPPVGVIHCCR